MVKTVVGSSDRARKCEVDATNHGPARRRRYASATTAGAASIVLGLMGALLCAALASLLVASAALASAGAGTANASSAAGRTVAWAAQAQVANDEGNLHLVGESGADLVEEGQMGGTFPGRARLLFTIGAIVSASFTLYPHGGGSVSGHGSGKLRSAGRYASFGGTMSVTSGTGRYRHAHGSGGFYGTILRKSPYPVVVQTRGTLSF